MFHREALLEAQRSNRVTLIPWDSPRYMPRVQRLWETLRICLFKADRFAFAFSVQPQRTRAWSFFVGVLFATLGITAAIAAMDVGLNPDQFRSLNDTILTLIGALLFTSLLVAGTTLATAIMLWLTNPHYDGQRHFTPWLSICCYASSHYLMVAIVLPFTPMAMTMTGGLVMINTGLVLVGCGGLCGFTLNAVMKHRTARHRRSTIGPVLLFVIYLAAPFCAMGATLFVVYFVDTYIF